MSLPTPAMGNPGYVAPGLDLKTKLVTVDMGVAAANFPLPDLVPLGAVVLAVAIDNTLITATTATKIGIGRLTATADPDKYYLSANLAAASASRVHNGWGAPITDAGGEQLGVCACNDSGAAAGTIGGPGQYAIVSVTYLSAAKI